jgi:hypothetical protein
VPSGACSEQVQRATAGLSGAQEVDIRCGDGVTCTCVGVAHDPCHAALDTQLDEVSPSKHVAAATVTCTSATCMGSAGEADIRILLGDGTVVDSHSGWSGGNG